MIDVNQQRFFILSKANQFNLKDQDNVVEWDNELRVLRMRSTRTIEDVPTNRQKANELADQFPTTVDAFGTWACVDATGGKILAGGVCPDSIPIVILSNGERVIDMAMNSDGVLYVIVKDDQDVSTIYMINRRASTGDEETAFLDGDENKIRLPNGKNQPDRIVGLSQGGALLLDRKNKVFWQIVGKPFLARFAAVYSPETPRPCSDGLQPQKLIDRTDLVLPADFEAINIASNPKGTVAVLLYPKAADQPAAVILISERGMSAPASLDKAMAPYSIGWVGNDQWALLFEDKKEALVYPVSWFDETPNDPVRVSGRRYPLNWGVKDKGKNKKFCNGLSEPVYYSSTDKQGNFILRPLYALSYPSYATSAIVKVADIIDSTEPNTVWHRLFLEAHLPKGTGVIVYLAAGEVPDELAHLNDDSSKWAEHHFGYVPVKPDIPRAVWVRDASEVPFFKGLLYCSPQTDTAGLFEVLVQRAGYAERSIRGRYLNIRIELTGTGHASPEVSALRIYHPRFSYLDRYLPELYRETNVRQKSSEPGAAGGSDFLRRFLCLFESVMTPLEGKVASSYMLTNPASAPAGALDWLGQWIGYDVDVDLNEVQKRLYIQKATKLYRKRGTMRGLEMLLDLITGDGVRRGDIVLLEDFRLRRTFATILGADFSVEDDPLLMGKIPNANSYVGETLFLGEEEKKEFLTLYGRDLQLINDEQTTIDNFYTRLANRLTVLVHKTIDNDALGLISRVVAKEVPAHIDFRIVTATKPLLIGLYSLLGVDTYMQKEPERRTARVGYSYLGRYDFIRKLPVLDGRLEP